MQTNKFSPQQVAAATLVLDAFIAFPEMVEELRKDVRALRAEVEQLRRSLPPSVVAIPEAATMLKVSTKTVRRQIAAGQLKAIRIGQSIRVDLRAIQAILNAKA